MSATDAPRAKIEFYTMLDKHDDMIKTRLGCGHIVWTTRDRLDALIAAQKRTESSDRERLD